MEQANPIGEVVEVLEDAPDAERPVGRFRLVAAVASLIGAAYVVAASGGAPLSIVVVVVVLAAAFFWWKRFAAVEQGVARGKRRCLTLGQRGLRWQDDVVVELSWADVLRIELDHDRIKVVVVHGAGSLDIEPPLNQLGLETLGQHIDAAFRRGAFKHDPASP